jgi:NAD(P)H-dependent FMN reductase
MTLNVLGISTSPRKGGNSDLLLQRALVGAASTGAVTEHLHLSDYKIKPCMECNSCYTTGRCVINDDYQQVLQKILDTDRLIFATPIFYMSVCAQAKMLIDRGQCMWATKHILKNNLFADTSDRRAMIIAVGGSKSIKQFDSVRWTMKTYFDSVGFRYVTGLFIDNVDAAGTIGKHPNAYTEAFRVGKLLATADTPPPLKPVEVELI